MIPSWNRDHFETWTFRWMISVRKNTSALGLDGSHITDRRLLEECSVDEDYGRPGLPTPSLSSASRTPLRTRGPKQSVSRK